MPDSNTPDRTDNAARNKMNAGVLFMGFSKNLSSKILLSPVLFDKENNNFAHFPKNGFVVQWIV
jgi:hypothetical protein